MIPDPYTRQEIVKLVNPLPNPTNFLFWQSVPEAGVDAPQNQTNTWGKSKNPGQHVWKASWYYKEDENKFVPAKHCDSIVSEVTGDNATALVAIFNAYKKS